MAVRKEENGLIKKALVSLNLIGPVIPNAEKMLLIGLKSKQTWWLMPQVQQNKNNKSFLKSYLLEVPITLRCLMRPFTLGSS